MMGRPKGSVNKTTTENAPAPKATSTAETISKAQIVRNALAEGVEAVGDIVEYAKAKHGVEIAKPQISLYKSNEKKKAGSPVAAKPKGEVKPIMPKSAVPPGWIPDGFIDDMEAIKRLKQKYGEDGLERLVKL